MCTCSHDVHIMIVHMCSRRKIPQKRSLATPVAVAVECVEKFYARGALCSSPAALCAYQRHLWRPCAHPMQTIELCWSKMMVMMMMCTSSSLYVSFCLCACIRLLSGVLLMACIPGQHRDNGNMKRLFGLSNRARVHHVILQVQLLCLI